MNVGMSSDKLGENPNRRKPKVSDGKVRPHRVNSVPKIKAKAVVDG